jgi:hypothetical protein
MTPQEYALDLIERMNSIRKAVGETNLRPIFSGAKRAVPKWISPEERKMILEGYDLAEKALFPTKPTGTG